MSNSKTGYTALGGATPVVVDAVVVPVVTERVEVIAPANLPGNYELHCDFQGRPVVVRVPPEGVKQGQQFVADVIRHGDSGSQGHRIPTGQWRDGCCDCFTHGLCHPMFWLAFCCRPLAIGQLMTRMGLTATGKVIPEGSSSRSAYWSAFKVIACVFVLVVAVDNTLSHVIMPYHDDMNYTTDEAGTLVPPDYASVPAWVWVVYGLQITMELLFALYMLVVLIRTRAHVRQRYSIPEQCCAGCEDCCCAFWLPCCTTLQIARHTADYSTYHAACCSETGLPPNAPQVV